METVSASIQPALKAIYNAAAAILNDTGFRHKLDGADLAEQKETAVKEALQKQLQPVSAKHASMLSYALQAWIALHRKLAPTFSCIGKHKSDGRLFMLSEDFTDVEKHSIESLLAARPYDVDVIEHGVRTKEKKFGLYARDDIPSSRELSGFLKPPKGVFQTDEKKAKELACCSKGFAEADGKLFINAYDYILSCVQNKTFEYSYKKVITALEARMKWLDSLYQSCFELNKIVVWNNDSMALAEFLAADNCKKLKMLFPSLAAS